MKRRRFLREMGRAAAGIGLGANIMGAGGPSDILGEGGPTKLQRNQEEEPFQRWTWVHGGGDVTPEAWNIRFEKLKGNGFQGVLVGGGETPVLAEAAHAHGLEFHRWVWTLNRNGDRWVKEHHPEWFTKSRNLESSLEAPPYVGYYQWLCPTRPEVRDYLRQSILNIAQDPSVDGIHLDYVRHSDVILPRGLWSKYDLVQDREYPEFDFCYCDACREAFSSRTGIDPLELPDPTADEAWRRFRWDSVTGLVKVLAEAVHGVPQRDDAPAGPGETPRQEPLRSTLRPQAPGKPISAAVFPTPTIARRLVRQAWDEWPLDAFFPMLYHEFYEEGLKWIGEGVAEGQESLTRRRWEDEVGEPVGTGGPNASVQPKLFAGLYLPTLNRDGSLNEAVSVAREAGAAGVSFFEMNGLGF